MSNQQLHPTAAQRIDEAIRTGATELDLSDMSLTELPEALGQLTSLQTLDLTSNQLSEVPEGLGKLTNLQYLNLQNNQLSDLPEVLGQLTSLQTLYLSGNQLSEVSEVLAQLTSLQTLYLAYNQLCEVPEVLGQLTSLQTLYLSGNQLSEVPEVLGQLTSLQWLHLSGNQLCEVPEVLGQLTSLQHLFLQNNQLSNVSNSLAQLGQLRYFNLSDNPLYPELSASYAKGKDFLMDYLHARAEDEIALYEAKLVLVGEGEVGKSSLLGALRGDPWIEDRITTHGIEIKNVELPYPDSHETLTLRGWDFGGQPIYRPTHQLFFSAPAIYLVVWKPREGPNQSFVHYWIELIKHRTDNEERPDQRPRVIVVATHGGPKQRQPHIDERALRDEFDDIIAGFIHVDSKTGQGMAELEAMIAQVAAEIPQVGRTVPASCKRVIDAVQRRSQVDPYISYREYEALCQEQQVDTHLAELYAAILNELGYAIHYSEDSALRDVMILKADWLTKAISFVLEDQCTIDNRGLVSHARLSQIWDDPARGEERYPASLHPLFLRLMERFDLSYRVNLDGIETTSLIAQLVPGQRPDHFDLAWPSQPVSGEGEQVQVCRIVDAESGDPVSMPSIFYNLIVRFHRFSLGWADYEQSVHWQNGLLLDDNHNGRALVEVIRNGIRVTVRAAYPKLFLYRICSDVAWLIESGWKGLDCRIMVPCPELDCQGLFEFALLMDARERGRDEYPCRACGEWPQIDALLATAAPLPTEHERHLQLLERLDEIDANAESRYRSASADLRRLISQSEEQFDQLMTALVDEAREGPRLISITPAHSDSVFGRDRWATQRIRITLWCEHSRLPVPLLSGDAQQGTYEIERPREWLENIAPYAQATATILSMALPVASGLIKHSLDEEQFKVHEKNLALSQTAFGSGLGAVQAGGQWLAHDDMVRPPSHKQQGMERLPIGSKDAFLAESAEEFGELTRLDGAPLRELQALLKELDPGFGGLERVQNNRREYLWVHPKHRAYYDPGFPVFPKSGDEGMTG